MIRRVNNGRGMDEQVRKAAKQADTLCQRTVISWGLVLFRSRHHHHYHHRDVCLGRMKSQKHSFIYWQHKGTNASYNVHTCHVENEGSKIERRTMNNSHIELLDSGIACPVRLLILAHLIVLGRLSLRQIFQSSSQLVSL